MLEFFLLAIIVILLAIAYEKIRLWVKSLFIDNKAPIRRTVEVPNPVKLPDEAKQFIEKEWRTECLEQYKKLINKKWKSTPTHIINKLDQRIEYLKSMRL